MDLKMKSTNILTDNDISNVTKLIGCEDEVIKAVIDVESCGRGYNKNLKIKILFEPHIFGKLTNYIYNKTHPHISSTKWDKSLYKNPYTMFDEAFKLNSDAALQATSYGLFQILGMNYSLCGYKNVIDFVNDMLLSEKKQLEIFVKFLLARKLDIYLKNKNWSKFAELYNGPSYKQNKYDEKLENAYKFYISKRK